MPSAICLDAGVVIKLVVDEPGRAAAIRLVTDAWKVGAEMVGPAFLMAEVLSVLRGKVVRGLIAPQDADGSMEALLALPIRDVSGPEAYRRAWEIASELDLPVVYDTIYLAVAETAGAVFWTADRRLHERSRHLGYVRLLSE